MQMIPRRIIESRYTRSDNVHPRLSDSARNPASKNSRGSTQPYRRLHMLMLIISSFVHPLMLIMSAMHHSFIIKMSILPEAGEASCAEVEP